MFNFENPLALDEQVVTSMREVAKELWPKECCGVIVDGRFIVQENIAKDPAISFEIDQKVWATHDNIQAIIHSHCAPRYGINPSELDMTIQIDTDIPWGIMHATKDWASRPLWFGEFRLDQPLVNRPFIHGVLDCYSLIRSYYWQQRSVTLPEYPRDDGWWLKGKDLYVDNFAKAGFSRMDPEDMETGDVVIFCMKGDKPHHAGIYLEGGQLLHHLAGRTSCTDAYVRWKKFATHHIRRPK
jgi:proteasome lid subunit RPN8/RPN11